MNIKNLKKTIPFKWRVQSAIPKNSPTHVQMIAYVDARDVAEHLDSIVGAENWQDKYYDVKGNLFCSIGIKIGSEWVWKTDCGTESRTEKEKGESSDAFKRAAVKWGINRDAYRVGMLKLNCKAYGSQYYPVNDKGVFLKGQELYDLCNKKAKMEDLENYDLGSESSELTQIKELYQFKVDSLAPEDYDFISNTITQQIKANYTKVLNQLKAL